MMAKLILLRFAQITGQLPLKLRQTNKISCIRLNDKIELTDSPINVLYTTIILIVYVLLTIASSYVEDINKARQSFEGLLAFNDIVNKYLFSTLGVVFIVTTPLRKRYFRRLYKGLDEYKTTYAKLMRYDEKLSRNENRRLKTIVSIVLGVSWCILTFVLDVYLTNLMESCQKFLLNLIVFSTIAQFVLHLQLIREEFMKINASLRQLTSSGKGCTKETMKCVQIVTIDDGYIKKLERRALTLSKCHDTLCDVCQCLNEIYTFQLLCFVTMSFLIVLFSIFSNYKLLFNVDMQNFGKDLLTNSKMAIFMTILMILTLNMTTRTTYQVNLVKWCFFNRKQKSLN